MASPYQTSESGHWRPYNTGHGGPGVGQVHEMGPYPIRRFAEQDSDLNPSLHAHAVSRAPSTASSSAQSAGGGGGGPIGFGAGYRSPSVDHHHRPPPSPPLPQQQQQKDYAGSNNPPMTMADRRSSTHTAAPSAYHDQAALRTVREDDEGDSDVGDHGRSNYDDGDDGDDGNGRRRGWRRFCCLCCCCFGDGDDTPLWARRLWGWIVFNRCLVYGVVAAILCTIVFGVIFGAVLPRLSSQPGPSPPPSVPASDDVPSPCTSSECSPTPLPTSTPSTTSSDSSTSSTSTSPKPVPTGLPTECNTKNYITSASFLAVHGDPNYLFAFSASRSPDECCAYCYRRVATGCHGWRFTPGSATTCTYIHSYDGPGRKDDTCPKGADVPVDIASDDKPDGPNRRNVAGVGPCGSL
ncbi:hypothetical protein RB597_005483 [Gaeumannomyces tritici]